MVVVSFGNPHTVLHVGKNVIFLKLGKILTRGPMTLAPCLTIAVRRTLANLARMLRDVKFETIALNRTQVTLKIATPTLLPLYM